MPAQALRLDLDGSNPVVSGMRFTPRVVFLYSTLSEAGVEEGTDDDGALGTIVNMAFADDTAAAGYATSAFQNPAVFVFGLGNSGAEHASAFAGDISLDKSISSWDPCGLTFAGSYSEERWGGIAFGSDEMLYEIGQLSLPDAGDDVVVSGLALGGNQPSVVMLIRQVGASGEDHVPGLGVWTPTGQWFNGNYVPALNPTGGSFSHDSIGHHYDDGCAIICDHDITGDVWVYELVPAADGFTLTHVSGTLPAEPIGGDHLFLAIYDPAADFNAGTLTTTGGVETVSGFTRPDALLVTRTNREVGEETTQQLPAGGDVDLTMAFYSMGSCDRFTPAYGFDPVPADGAVIGLRVDEATGDGVYAAIGSGFAIALTVVGGTIATIIDVQPASAVEGDVVGLICDGDDVTVTLNGATVASGTQTDIAGPGRLFLTGRALDDARCGTIGAPPLIDNFNGPDAFDIGAPWQPAFNPIGGVGGENMSRAKNQMVAADTPMTDADDQASYLDGVTFTDAEATVVVGQTVLYDDEHNAFMAFASLWSGAVRHASRLMGGYPFQTASGAVMPINHDQIADSAGTYPDGPFLEIDADRANGWGVTPTGWAGDVFSDAGNHQVGWLLCKLGRSAGSGPCGFPARRRRGVPGLGSIP